MGIHVDIRRRFTVNGKEYGSTGEMPDDLREAFEKAMADGTGSGINIQSRKTRIVLNGREYPSLEAMPPEARQLYEKVIKAAETGSLPAGLVPPGGAPLSAGSGSSRSGAAVRFEPSFPAKKALAWIALIAAVILLYVLSR